MSEAATAQPANDELHRLEEQERRAKRKVRMFCDNGSIEAR